MRSTLGNRLPITKEKQLVGLKELRERKIRKLGQLKAYGESIYLIKNQIRKERVELEMIEQDIATLSH